MSKVILGGAKGGQGDRGGQSISRLKPAIQQQSDKAAYIAHPKISPVKQKYKSMKWLQRRGRQSYYRCTTPRQLSKR